MTAERRRLVALVVAAAGGGVIIAAGLWLALLRQSPPLAFSVLGQAAELAAPAWLLLLACTPAILLVAAGTLADFPRGQLALQAGLRVAVLAALSLALGRPALRRESRDVSIVALVDVSESVPDREVEAARALVADLVRAAPDRVRVVRFAGRPEEVPRGDRPASAALGRLPGADGAATDIALALGLGAGLVDPGTLGRLFVLSDGEETSGDALAEAERARRRGLRVHTRFTGGRQPADVAVLDLLAPDDVRPHAPFQIEVRILASLPGRCRVRLERLDAGGGVAATEGERDVVLGAGANAISFQTRVEGPLAQVFRASIVEAENDRRHENDHGLVAVAPVRSPRVLLVDGEPAAAATFAAALEAEHVDVDVRGPRGFPARGDLDRWDLVVISDVARAEIGERPVQALEDWVKAGGGLLMAGGANGFGSGGWAGSRVEAILPVRLDLPERREEATLALALVIDKSGSMTGPKMDLTKEAARATAETLPPDDQIAVVVFDSLSSPVVRLQRAANRGRILGDIARIQPSGGTNIFAGLREAIEELLPAHAKKKHVILLSDGQSAYEGIPELVDDATAGRITISAVGVGEGADQTLLQSIASRGGGRFYFTRDPSTIPRIFSRETAQLSRSSIVEEPTAARVAKRAEMLGGVALDGAPRLKGYVLTRSRPGADVILTTSGGDPLFARWQVGLGQVAAWTSDVKARWSADWARWSGFPRFWAQAVRSTMRRRAAERFPLHATLDADLATVTVDVVGADDRFESGLEGHVEIVDAADAGHPRRVALGESAPGRYQASFPAGPPGARLLRATLTRKGVPLAEAAGRLTIPFAPELRPPVLAPDGAVAPGSKLLAALRARTGGREIRSAAEVLDPGRDAVSALRPARTPLLLGAASVFILDVLVRRVRLGRRGRVGPAVRP